MAETANPPTNEAPPPAQARKPRAPAKAEEGSLGITFDDSTPGVQKIHLSRNDILCDLFHTKDPAQASALLSHCLKTVRVDETDGDGITDDRGFMVSVVRDLAPRDVVERMLAVQMATTHVALIRAARSLAGADLLPQFEAHSTNYNKLARTFAAQVEALKRHRSKGQQVVRVERVNVEPGGQAIVGEVHHGGRGASDER
jgi:hypothetical protein